MDLEKMQLIASKLDQEIAMTIVLGSEQLLDSGRTGRQVTVNYSDNPVFLDNQGKLVCHHGERAASIQEWISKERTDPSYERPSRCDCGNIDGLLTDYDIDKNDRVKSPSQGSLYKLLGSLGAEQKVINTRPQRKAITTSDGEVWVQPAGTLVCVHGNTRKTLAKMAAGRCVSFKRKSLVPCNCMLKVPRRTGSIFGAFRINEATESTPPTVNEDDVSPS